VKPKALLEGKYRITEVMVRPRVALKDKAELERARAIMEGVEAQCFISNSIKSKVSLALSLSLLPRQSETNCVGCASPVLARLRHAGCIEQCPISRPNRKTYARKEFFSV
jgi:hypothetical protein